jgi:DNA-binding HxlR family transcriptional regulator
VPKTTQLRVDGEACARSDASLVRAFDLLGRRWTGVVLGTLSDGPASFRELARAVQGISDSMLATRLGELTADGLITRTVDEGPPLSVAYELTHAGRALLPALEQISRWADKHLPADNQHASTVRRKPHDSSPLSPCAAWDSGARRSLHALDS